MIRSFQNHYPVVADSAFIDPTALVVGDVTLGENVSIWPMAVLRGDVNRIVVGDNSNIQDGAVVHVAHEAPHQRGFAALVGADVTVGHRAVIHACTVGDRVLVGMGAIIMDGAVVGDDVVVGANTLVPPGKRLAGGKLYVGSPARAVRALTESEREQLVYSARHYVTLKQRHEEKGH